MDLILELQTRRRWFRTSEVQVILKDRGLRPGTIIPPPAGVWGKDVDLTRIAPAAVAAWMRDCLGEPIRQAISQACGESDDVRLLITPASTAEQEALLGYPWEILESADQPDRLGRRSPRVVRVLDAVHDAGDDGKLPRGLKLRLAVLWANPDQDIPALEEHLASLQLLASGPDSAVENFTAIEFRDADEVARVLSSQHPDVLYFIGHCGQEGIFQSRFRVGPRGQGQWYAMSHFEALVQQAGPPELLVLNSCSTTAGHTLDPYLGAALTCVHGVPAVVSMQTDAHAPTTIPFVQNLMAGVARNLPVSEALRRARETVVPPREFPFQTYVPVLLQQTTRDRLFAFNLPARDVQRDLNRLLMHIEHVDPYFTRHMDAAIERAMCHPPAGRSVTLVHGPSQVGKSTSVREFVRRRLVPGHYAAGERWYYHSATLGAAGSPSGAERCRQLLQDFSAAYNLRLNRNQPESPLAAELPSESEVLRPLVNWLNDESGGSLRVCFDNLPDDVCSFLARYLPRVVLGSARVLLVGTSPPDVTACVVNAVPAQAMDLDELAAAAQQRRETNDEDVQRLLDFSNGLPLFASLYLRSPGLFGLEPKTGDAVKALIAPLPPDARQLLASAAHWEADIPPKFFEEQGSADALAAIRPLLIPVGSGGYWRVPLGLRADLRAAFEGDLEEMRLQIYGVATALADDQRESYAPDRMMRTLELYQEAFRQASALARQAHGEGDDPDEYQRAARQIALILYDLLALRQNRSDAAWAVWQGYSSLASSLGQRLDRELELNRADCLRRMGRYEEAIGLLDQITFAKENDLLDLKASRLYGTLLKDRGENADRADSVGHLEEGLRIGRQLSEHDSGRELRHEIAGLEHALGNALSYGQDARPDEALRHLERARELYTELDDFLQYRSVSEMIELKRYNDRLSADEHTRAVATLSANLPRLAGQQGRYDLANHYYELGRLEKTPQAKVARYDLAQLAAGKVYRQVGLHAAVKALLARVDAGAISFDEAEPKLAAYAQELAGWQRWAWSRRARRNLLMRLARDYGAAGRSREAAEAWTQAADVVQLICGYGEGRTDARQRHILVQLAAELSSAGDALRDRAAEFVDDTGTNA